MAYIPRSSLIPTEASGAIPVQMKKKRTIHAFGLVATIIFVFSLVSAVGTFLYKDYLADELTKAKSALDSVSTKDNQAKIAEIKYYDDKLRIARKLLDDHIAASRIFEHLEDTTKSTVQFTGLEFIHDPGFEALITLKGTTKEFSGVALQKMQIFRDGIFSDFVLQGITTTEAEEDSDGTVTPRGIAFSVTGVFIPEMLAYTGGAVEDGEKESALPIMTSPDTTLPSVVPLEGTTGGLPPEVEVIEEETVIPQTP